MTQQLQNRVAIVTGAAQGIGEAYALGMARAGAKVVVADILDGANTVSTITESGRTAISLMTDVTNEDSVQAMVEATLKEFGRIDILVNNAAVFVSLYPLKDFDQIPIAEWDKVMAVNLRGIFLTCKAAVPHMRQQQYGRIINIASNVFWRGVPGFLHYATSKAGVIGLTRSLSHEVGKDGITVNGDSAWIYPK